MSWMIKDGMTNIGTICKVANVFHVVRLHGNNTNQSPTGDIGLGKGEIAFFYKLFCNEQGCRPSLSGLQGKRACT